MIVKVQWPLVGEPLVFICNQDKSVSELLPCTRELKEAMQGRLKIYYHAHLGEDKTLYLDEKAEDQPW